MWMFFRSETGFSLDSCPLGKWKESKTDWINEKFGDLIENMEKNES